MLSKADLAKVNDCIGPHDIGFGMDLHEYPRPTNDTGIGIHWTTGYATAIGMRQIKEFWIPEMKALGVKWVKIYNHDGALDFAELLLTEGFMPIVRIYRPTPNPSRLDVKDVVQIDSFLRTGVRYFEFNSEPDRDAEWKGGRMPANGLNLVVDNTIANLEIILERGGMPAVPAVSNGSRWDIVGKIVAFGRKDLFAGPVWQAIHNYPRNRPLDYPYDIGNQEGAAYTYRFYQAVQEERWTENAWRGRSLDEINRLRSDRSNPGATIMDDASCWLAYEYFDTLNRKHLGHSIPLLSTECGYLVGEDVDPRYPATTPDLHMAQTLETARVMMGTSQRFAPAPDYYFCTAFWLLGNAQLGSTSSWWETHAWYSDRWRDGALPVVFALKAEPKVARHWHGEIATDLVTVHGAVAHAGSHQQLELYKGNVAQSADSNTIAIAKAELDEQSRYQFPHLAPGIYTLRIPGTNVEQIVSLTAGQEELVLDFDLAPTRAPVNKSRLEGTVRGGAGAMLLLVRSEDGEEWAAMVKEDGTFRFVDLPAGEYSLRVNPLGSRFDRIVLDGLNQRDVELAVAGWGYTIRPLSAAQQKQAKLNSMYVSVEGQRGLPVRVHAGEWSSEPVYTGTAPEIGENACELTGLEAGHYIVAIDGVPDMDGRYTQLEARVQIDRKQTLHAAFVYTDLMATPTYASSKIDGRVVGLRGKAETAILLDSMGHRTETAVKGDGTFRFGNLSAGLYSVALLKYEESTMRSDLALDGNNVVTVELRLPTERSDEYSHEPTTTAVAQSVIHGVVPNAQGKLARLVDSVGNEYRQYVDGDQRFYFDQLPAESYTLFVESGYKESQLLVDGQNGLEVHFAELLPAWEAEVSHAGSMPGYSLVRVEVEDMADLPVHIWKDDWEGMVRKTGTKADYGPYALEFSPLDPGHYFVEPDQLGIGVEVDLTGLEALWVHFRRQHSPLGTNRVLPMAHNRPQAAPPSLESINRSTATSNEDATAYIEDGRAEGSDVYVPDIYDLGSTAPSTPFPSSNDAPAIEAIDNRTDRTASEAASGHEIEIGNRQTDENEAVEQTIEPDDTRNSPLDAQADRDASDVDYALSAVSQKTSSAHYLFLYNLPKSLDDLTVLLRYVAQEQPQIGRDRWSAFDAERVTLIGGDPDALDVQEFAQALRSADVEVNVIAADFAAHLPLSD